MATGIVSQAMLLDGATALAGVLLGLAIAGYLALLAVQSWQAVLGKRSLAADARDATTAFGFFAFGAATDVLADRLAVDGHTGVALALLAVGALAWLVLSYAVPVLVAASGEALHGANGSWFLWVVGVQSVAVAITALPSPLPPALLALGIGCWCTGVALYAIVAVTIWIALLRRPPQPAELTPAYWVAMGATAISVLAGARLAALPPDPLSLRLHAVLTGTCVAAWAFGSWLIPPLIAAGVWRHVLRRVPLRYEPALWSLVFPLGMYGVASRALGVAVHVGWLVRLGQYEAWLALAAWLAVACALAWQAVRLRPGAARP